MSRAEVVPQLSVLPQSSGVPQGSRAPQVSVIIPTIGRTELSVALASVRAQVGVTVEIIVVHNGTIPMPRSVTAGVDRLLVLPAGSGGCRARNAGVDAASAPWVAFLDDDDAWLPHKLAAQLAAAQARPEGEQPVCVSRVVLARPAAEPDWSRPVPAVAIRPGQRPEEYLFRRRGLEVDRNALFTSALFMPTTLARRVRWDESLPRHQDWDFVVRCSREPAALVLGMTDVLGVQRVGSAHSVSAGCDWEASFAWLQRWDADWSRSTSSDFLWGQVMRHVLADRSLEGFRAVVRKAPAYGPPSVRSVGLGLAGLIPRRSLERLALGRRPRRAQADDGTGSAIVGSAIRA